LQRALGPAAGLHLHRLAWGEDRRSIGPAGQAAGQAGHAPGPRHTAPGWPASSGGAAEPEKSTGAEETFSRDVDDPDVVLRELLRLSAKVAARIRTARLAGRTVTVKVRFADFTTITRSRTRAEATDVTREIYQTAAGLYRSLGLQRARLRLVGVRVEGLVPRSSVYRQLVLGAADQGWPEADRAVDRAVSRFGRGAVQPASLLAAERTA
jgi:DNA polymerase IV